MTRIQQVLLAATAFFVALLSIPGTRAFADAVPITTSSNSLAQVKISPFLMTLIIAQVLPLLTGFLTKLSTPPWVKGLITLGLNAITAVVASAAMVGGSYVFTKETVIAALLGFVASHVSYMSVLKKVGLTSSAIEVPDPNAPGQTIHLPGKLAAIGVTEPPVPVAAVPPAQ